jgi:hypothetical protein
MDGQEITKIGLPVFFFLRSLLHAVSSDQSVFITIVRDLLSFAFCLLCYE